MDTIEQLLQGGWTLSVWHIQGGGIAGKAIGAELWFKRSTVQAEGVTVAEAIDNVVCNLLAPAQPIPALPAGD